MKIKKRYAYTGVVLVLILAALLFYLNTQKEKPKDAKQNLENQEVAWVVDKDGYLDYPLERGAVPFNRADYDETESLLIFKIIYESRNGNIYGLMVMPKFAEEALPAVVLLPGAGVSKESELRLAKEIANLGAVVLTIDQRGVGETDGKFPSLDEDYQNFLNGKEPYQHLLVYDALRAYDLLNEAPFVDSERIIIAGESFGGRIAVIAAAIDRNVEGALVISSSGFDFKDKGDAGKDVFLKSIDSDHYIGLLTPRKLVVMHSLNDGIIPLGDAVKSFFKAQEPKKIFLVNDTGCNHGYCDSMYNGLVEGLKFVMG